MKIVFFYIQKRDVLPEGRLILLAILASLMVSCGKQLDQLRPHNVIFEDAQFDSSEGYTKAVSGIYSLIALGSETGNSLGFTDMQIFFSEAKGNTIKALDAQINRNTDVFDYQNSASRDRSWSYFYWRSAYNALLHINKVIGRVEQGETDPVILQAKAECLFLRAYVYFNLIRLYGKPYYQDPASSLGVMLVLSDQVSPNFKPARATVEEVYQQIVIDLESCLPLFTQSKSSSFASKYAAEALLSRVELYRGGTFSAPDQQANAKAFEHAERVIREGGFRLLENELYSGYYDADNRANTEDIFAINGEFTNGYIAGLFKMPPNPSYSGGLYRPSPFLLSLMSQDDRRRAFYVENLTPGYPDDVLAVNKYNIGYVTLYSRSPYRALRLTEMYLNKAEALVKLKRDSEALQTVNVIRQRAGLMPLSGINGETLFMEILKQRKIELAFEGHASYDEFRNGLPMVRNYASGSSGVMTVQPTDPGILMQLPAEEIADNSNLTQNPK